ncbi:MAG: hypothetical protein ABFC85_07405 [Rectinema sp.]|jgi:hypothetical protein|uniref:Lipoprotein n=1 Tax=uncultured spirochete TaxID=156406 RepID=A0A3P3XSV7_9SPIR|nr:exported hypothetical protein [uncultured spirochete]
MKKTKYPIILIAGLIVFLWSCQTSPSDEELSSSEEEFVAEQTAASISTDEGGALYTTKALSDPSYYENLEDEAEYDATTGTFSVTTSIDLTYKGSTSVNMSYKLYDTDGNVQSSFDSATTYRVEATMQFSHDVNTNRYEAHTSKSTNVTVTGLNTDTVVVNGEWLAERTAQTSSSVPQPHETTLSHHLLLRNITYTKESETGQYLLSGGSASSQIEGSINNKSFTRSVQWTFGDSNTATMTYQGETMTVNITTGVIVD